MKRFLNQYRYLPIQVRASFWFLICTILQRSITIITTPIFTRILSTKEYGRYSIFTSWMAILTCFITLYIYADIYIQTVIKYDKNKAQYSSAMQGLTITLVLGWLMVYLVFSEKLNKVFSLNTYQMVAMILIIWGHAVFGFWSAEQRVDYKYQLLVIVTFLEAVLQPIISIFFMCVFENKVTGLVWGMAITLLMFGLPIAFKQLANGKVFVSKKMWGDTLKLAIPLIPHYTSSVLLNCSDRIMIQKIAGERQAGIYNLAYTISICGTIINQAMLQTIQPWIIQKIKEKRYQEIKKVAYPILIIIAVINLVIILFTPEIMMIFAPQTYGDAIWIMPPIILSVFFMFLYNLFSYFEFYYEKVSYVSSATGVGAVLNILLNYIFIHCFGYYAAGYTTLVCYILFAVAHYLFMRKICKKEIDNVKVYDIKILFVISVIFILAGFSIMFFYKTPYIRYIIMSGVVLIAILKRDVIRKYLLFFLNNKKLSDISE